MEYLASFHLLPEFIGMLAGGVLAGVVIVVVLRAWD